MISKAQIINGLKQQKVQINVLLNNLIAEESTEKTEQEWAEYDKKYNTLKDELNEVTSLLKMYGC